MTTPDNLEPHPLAEIFPLMDGADFDALVEDIEANGIREPVTLYEGKVLDGRNRLRAAQVAARTVPVPQKSLRTGADPIEFIISANVRRRHLNESQRAMVAAKLTALRLGANQHTKEGPSIEEAARLLNVGHASVERARTVMERAAPELRHAVEMGDASVSAAAELTRLSEHDQRAVVEQGGAKIASTAKTLRKKEHREIREVELAAKQRGLPDARFGVIYADPPWRFEPYSRDTGMDRSADNHYPTKGTGEIADWPVQSIAADDCCLFLWATPPMIEHALSVMKVWGFEYKTQAVWIKESFGTGYWFRQQHEILLVATRGKIPAPAPGTQFPSIIMAKVSAHSEKPTRVYQIIEKYFPNLPRIELFARRKRLGWEVWGNEIDDSVADSIDGDGVAYADEEKPDATDFSDAEHQRPEPGERGAEGLCAPEETGAAGGGHACGENGGGGDREGSEAPASEGIAGEGEDAFGGLEFDKPGFSDAARA